MPEYQVDLYGSKGSPSNLTVSVTADNAHRAKQLAVHQYGGRATNVHPVNWENPTIGADDHKEVTHSSSSSGGGLGWIVIAILFFGGLSMCSSDESKQQQKETVTYSQPVNLQERVENNNCRIWANANPTLAAKLKSGDQCFGY